MKKTITFFAFLIVSLFSISADCKDIENGKATYYSKSCTSKTASGERMSPDIMTCAHKKHPFGTILKVTNKKNGKSVFVRVNDRGPFGKGIIVDLSWGAAKELDMLRDGIVNVTVEVVEDENLTPESDTEISIE